MTRRSLTVAASIVAGLGWIAKSLGEELSPDPDYWNCNSSYDYGLNAIDTVAFLASAAAIAGIYYISRAAGERLPPMAFASAVGFATAGAANLLEHCASLDVLGIAYVTGLLVGLVFLIVTAIALSLRHVVPPWAAWLLAAGALTGLLFAYQGGLIAFGIAWIVFGVALVMSPREP
jgi:hypothetical protein